jgi:hypothetical protein
MRNRPTRGRARLWQPLPARPNGPAESRRRRTSRGCGFVGGNRGAGAALPNRSFDRARCDHVHASVARREVCGDGTRHREQATLGGRVGGDARLPEIVMNRPTKDDAGVVVQQRHRGIHRKERGAKVGVDHVLESASLLVPVGVRPEMPALGKTRSSFPKSLARAGKSCLRSSAMVTSTR